MLLSRVITAVVLAPLVIWLVLASPVIWFAVAVAAIFSLAVYEWAGMLGESVPVWRRAFYVLAFIGATALMYSYQAYFGEVLLVGCIVWGLAIVAVLTYPRGRPIITQTALLLPLGIFLPVAAWVSLVSIKQLDQGSWWVLWVLILVWAADIGAYFAGRFLGSHKLAPQVSPGKTWEGVGGGFVLAGLVCGAALIWWQGVSFFWLSLMLALIGVSVFGDLFESLIKRARGVKDSGSILPGHGGMLDRVDSLLAVLPVIGLALTVEA